jgi:hypothetical protein
MYADQLRGASCTSTSPSMKPSKGYDLVEGLAVLPVRSLSGIVKSVG